MGRFIKSGFPIVKIGNRMFFYIFQNKEIWGFSSDLSSIGFEKMKGYFRRSVDKQEIESAYRVKGTYVVYKGYRGRYVSYNEETGEFFVVFDDDLDGKALGIKPRMETSERPYAVYEAVLPEKDIIDIYEVRVHEEGFIFESPRIIFHKRDGKWLPYHELGEILEDDEWK